MTKFENAIQLFKENINLFTWDNVRNLKHAYAVDIMTNETNPQNEELGLNLASYIISSLDYFDCYYTYGQKTPVYIDSKTQASFVGMVHAVIKNNKEPEPINVNEKAQKMVTERIEMLTAELKVALKAFGGTIEAALDIMANKPMFNGYEDKQAILKYFKYLEDNNAACKVEELNDKIQGLLETRSKTLMYCPKNYVVTDTDRLVSPRGFNSCDRVFIQTEIAIHMDEEPNTGNTPSCNKPLYAHDIEILDRTQAA